MRRHVNAQLPQLKAERGRRGDVQSRGDNRQAPLSGGMERGTRARNQAFGMRAHRAMMQKKKTLTGHFSPQRRASKEKMGVGRRRGATAIQRGELFTL